MSPAAPDDPTGGTSPAPPSDGRPVRWRVVRDAGPAAALHLRDPGPDPGHQLWIRRVPAPALVLGSTQPAELIRADRARADGIEVCRRRSGGGLVYLDPTTDCWLDAIVPAGSPYWDDDVGRAFHWLGRRWAATLDGLLGPAGPALVHRLGPGAEARLRRRPLWCFETVGHGEVTIGASKVVGLSQRRTRGWIRLQSLALGAWPGRRLSPYLDREVAAELVGGGAGDPAGPPVEIDPAAILAGPPTGIRLPDPDRLADAFVERLGNRTG